MRSTWNFVNDVVFVGAAGTSKADLPKNYVFFPASKDNVLAASAADLNGYRDNQSHYGAELDLVAFQPSATVGGPNATLDELANSSSATAFVSGVAALVRSKYPFMSNSAVMNRLKSTAGGTCQMGTAFGPAVNAEAAVGGLCLLFVSGPTLLEFYDDTPNCQTLTYEVIRTGGVGPFTYSWNWGNNSVTGENIQQTFCRPPTRDDDSAQIQVTANDQGAGVTKSTAIGLRIINWSAYPCEERPDINECGGGH